MGCANSRAQQNAGRGIALIAGISGIVENAGRVHHNERGTSR